MVPNPNPEKKVRMATKKAVKDMTTYSTCQYFEIGQVNPVFCLE